MRSYVPEYELRAPASLEEALRLMAEKPGEWKPFAGGTDLMVLFEAGKLPHKKFLSLWHLADLKGIEVAPDAVTLGALIPYTQIQRHPVLQQEFPMLCQAARETGGIANQNRGTLAGNIVNASPAADSPPALLAYGAELELVSAHGARWLSYDGFHNGYKEMNLRPEELIRRIRLPRENRPRFHYYRKVGTRKAQAISKVCFAGVAEASDSAIRDIRIALGSVAPTVIRCPKTENALRHKLPDAATIVAARTTLAGELSPIDDIRSTKAYRLRVAQNLLADFLQQIASGRLGFNRT